MLSLSHFQTLLWLSVIITQIVLAAIARWRQREFDVPLLSLFIYFVNVQSLSLLGIILRYPRWSPIYALTYYAFSLAGCTILLLLNVEVYKKVFGPRFALPKGTPRRVATMLAISISGCVALGCLLRSTRGNGAIRILNTADGVLLASSAAILWTLRLYSRKLGISWSRQMRGVVWGLLFFLTSKSIAVFITGVGTPGLAWAASTAGQVAYLVAVIRWCACLSAANEKAESLTEEMVGVLSKEFSHIKLAARDATGHIH